MSFKLKNIYVIVPAFNEAKVIHRVVSEILGAGYQVILVDDGSTDQSEEICKSLPIHYLRHEFNLGQGAALMTGMAWARRLGAEAVVHFDADGQHQISSIKELMLPLEKGEADVVLGSRFLRKSDTQLVPKGRRRVLQLGRWVNFLLTSVLLTDAHNGLRALNQKALFSIQLKEAGRAHATEILQQIKEKGLRWKEVPVEIHYSAYSRQKGTSFWDGFQVLGDLLMAKIR